MDQALERVVLDGIHTRSDAWVTGGENTASGGGNVAGEGGTTAAGEDVIMHTPVSGVHDLEAAILTGGMGEQGSDVATEQNTTFTGPSDAPMIFHTIYPPSGNPDYAGFPPGNPNDLSTYLSTGNPSFDNATFGSSPWFLFPPNASVGPTPAPISQTTRQTPWMPDFTFGPASELIDIAKFLETVEAALGRPAEDQAGSAIGENKWIRPEHVAGWDDLRALGAQDRQALNEACSVTDLLAPLTDITSDPARLDVVREMHNQATLAALGHTVESIKLPPEKRDRKRKKGGKVDVGDKNGHGQDGHVGAQERADEQGLENNTAVSPSGTPSASVSGDTPTPAAAHMRGGKIRKGKARAEAEDTTSNPALLELGDMLGSLKLRSWLQSNTARHYIRKPRSSDVNVLAKVRASTIPFVLPSFQPDTSANITDLQGSTVHGSPHSIVELSILTPAPHPPHTPRHTLSLALLNSQTLEDISEALVCPNRWVPRSINDSQVPSGGCIVVEGTVYGDGEGDADGKDYADKVTEYVATLKSQASAPTGLGKKERDAIMILDEQLTIGLPMLSTRLDSVRWKLHKPYWFMHDGGCIHWVVVSSISLLHPQDPPLPTPEKASNWPYVTSLSPLPHRALCRVCSRVPAVLAVSGDSRLGESPSLVCNGCWALLGPPKAGRDYPEGGGLTILPLVSPDGL